MPHEWLILVRRVVLLMTLVVSTSAQADVYQWQWVDANDHSFGKTQSSILCPDGAGIIAGPGSVLGKIDLSRAYLYSLDLSYSSWFSTILNDAYFGKANLNQMLLYDCDLRNADFTAVDGMGHFRFSDLTGADFTDAKLKHFSYSTIRDTNFTRADLSNGSIEYSSLHGANFTDAIITGTQFINNQGFTQDQLHATASYKNGNLRGLGFGGGEDLSGWDFSGGVDLSFANFIQVKLQGARFNGANLTYASFLIANLNGADLSGANLTNANLEAGDLTNANLSGATLSGANAQAQKWTNANLTDAIIAGADMHYAEDLTAEQVYSTASYQTRDLRRIWLNYNDMTGWSFQGIDLSNSNLMQSKLTGADFTSAKLTGVNLGRARLQGADFTGALFSNTGLYSTDLRGATVSDFTGADTSQAIMPDGTVNGLGPRELFSAFNVTNYLGSPSIPVRITQAVNRPFRIQFLFDNNPWHSTVSFDPGTPVDITNTSLVLTFDDAVDPSELFGQTFRVFDWSGVNPIGQFDLSTLPFLGYDWDTSHLYSDGLVTLVGVPEPWSITLLAGMAVAHLTCRRRASRLLTPARR